MWIVFEATKVSKALNKLPIEIAKKFEKWKDVIHYSGPEALRTMKGLRDEALRGEWFGYRSSRLSLKYRVIYKVDKNRKMVLVVDVNPHKY